MIQAGTGLRALSIIKKNFSSMSETEKKIGAYLLEHSQSSVYMTTKMLASAVGVSEGSIINFSTKLGFSGFSDLKINLAQQVGPEADFIFDNVTQEDSPKFALKKMIDNMASTMQATYDAISNQELSAIAELLINTKGRIEIYGVGSSSMIANDVYYRLMRIGLPAYAVTDPHISAVSASMLTPECVAIGISYSGRTIETLDTMKHAKARGAKTVCVTNYASSPLARMCDYSLIVVSKEAQVHKEAVTARLAQLLVFDSICAYISCRRQDYSMELMDNVIDIIGEHRESE